MALNITGMAFSLIRGPFWGLLVYANMYFITIHPKLNWWAQYVPQARWGLLSSAVLLTSMFLHRDKLSKWQFACFRWEIALLLLTGCLALTVANARQEALDLTYRLATYVMASWILVRVLRDEKYFNWFCLAIIGFSAFLSLNAFLYGKRIHERLEGIGPNDANGSNEFGLLLASILPLLLPFLLKGKFHEKVICLLSLPFLINAFILCNSRGAFVAIVASLFVLLLFPLGKDSRKKILIVAVLFIPVFMYLADAAFFDRLLSLALSDKAIDDQGVAAQLSSGRTEIWKVGIEMAKDHPFGLGPEGFRRMAHLYMPETLLSFDPSYEYGTRASHNTYLQIMVEQGIVGLLLLLGLCLNVLLLLWGRIRKSGGNKNNAEMQQPQLRLVALLFSFFISLFGGLFTARMYYEFFWWQIALATVAASLADGKDTKLARSTGVENIDITKVVI